MIARDEDAKARGAEAADPESPIVVTAVFTPIEGRRDELIAAMARGIAATHREAGCELYAIHAAEDGTVTMLEKWTTAAHLDAHATGAAIAALNEDIADLLARPVVVTRMTPVPAGTSAQGML